MQHAVEVPSSLLSLQELSCDSVLKGRNVGWKHKSAAERAAFRLDYRCNDHNYNVGPMT